MVVFEDRATRATLYYAGALYDDVYVKLGGAGSLVYAKKELEFEFNRDHELDLRGTEVAGMPPDSRDFDIINITTTASDESYVQQPLAWRAYAVAGIPASISFPLRLQEGGEFFSVAVFVEQPSWMQRIGPETRFRRQTAWWPSTIPLRYPWSLRGAGRS